MPSSFKSRMRRYRAVGLVLIAGLAISGGLSWILHVDAVRQDQARFESEASLIALALEQNMERYEERLARLADFCALFEEMPTRIWSFRSETMTDVGGNLPAVVHALYCPKIVASNFQAHLEEGRRGSGSYLFDAEARPSRDYALPVWQFYTRPGFVRIPLGTDMASETNWHPSLHQSLATARGWVSPQPMQVARTNGTMETGLWFALTLFPLNQKATDWKHEDETEKEMSKRHATFKRAAATGSLAVFISTDHLIDRYNDPRQGNRLDARLHASAEPKPQTLFNSASPRPQNPRHRRVSVMKWYGRRWALELTSTPIFEADSLRYRAAVAFWAGSSITVLAGTLVGVLLAARTRQEEMTEDVLEARDALMAAEKEREKLGHDLHDGAIQSLYAVQLGLTRTAENVAASVPSAAQVLNETRARVDEVIAELRRFILARGGHEQVAAPGLENVLASMVERLRATTQTDVTFDAEPGVAAELSMPQVVQLTQIVRTALGNSFRHAHARQVTISLRRTDSIMRLEIADDGVGFDPQQPTNGGMGLQTMQSRAAEAGATIDVDSRPSGGTRIVVAMPRKSDD